MQKRILATAESTLASERVRINLSWLIKLRWAAFVGQLATVFFVWAALHVSAPVATLVAVAAVEGFSNLALAAWFRCVRGEEAWPRWTAFADRLLGFVLAADNLFLTALLYESGGPTNPFGVFYLANLTLAAVILPSRGAWSLTAFACVCYASLFFGHVPLLELAGPHPAAETSPPTNDLRHAGMLAAFVSAAAVIVYFTARVTRELARREAELSRAQQLRARSEKLEALGTLAAGAAHELSSPLSTIAVATKELTLMLQQGKIGPDAMEDAQLIREEVERCRTILQQMASDAGQAAGEALQRVVGADLLAAIVEGARDASRLSVDVGAGVAAVVLVAPKHALAQALRGLIHNALDASEPDGVVELAAVRSRGALTMTIRDRGRGMPADVLARAGEPFFTTKEPGKGMGLGLFLARTLVERLGGELKLDSRAGGGAIAAVELPIEGET